MATKAGDKSAKGQAGVDWSNRIGNGMVRPTNDRSSTDADTPWTLLIAVIVLCFLLMIIVPVMGLMYVELNQAANSAIKETHKMRELRRQIMQERVQKSSGAIDVDREPTEAADPRQ